jgi:hypothetical protein
VYLQLDESNETDPFVCFRRRDAKAVRKTRRADNTPADKITRLRIELQQVSDLATSVVTRELKKAELGRDSQLVLEARLHMFDHKRRFPHLSNPQDDQMLIEQERMPPAKRPRMNEPAGYGGFISLPISDINYIGTEFSKSQGGQGNRPSCHLRMPLRRASRLSTRTSGQQQFSARSNASTNQKGNLVGKITLMLA